MSQFAFALDTKSFRNEGEFVLHQFWVHLCIYAHDYHACMLLVLNVGGQAVEVHVHLYETTANMLENRGGGIWHPDELARLLKKIKQYLGLLRNPDIFFSRVQIWGK